MTHVVLSLGSNLADSKTILREAVQQLPGVIAASAIYRTPAWGYTEQADFLNQVVIANDPDLTPEQWLALGQTIENKYHRQRLQRWGPRTLDIDLIAAYDDFKQPIFRNTADLMLPHPLAHTRGFVLVPWQEIDAAANLEISDTKSATVASLIALLSEEERQGIRQI